MAVRELLVFRDPPVLRAGPVAFPPLMWTQLLPEFRCRNISPTDGCDQVGAMIISISSALPFNSVNFTPASISLCVFGTLYSP